MDVNTICFFVEKPNIWVIAYIYIYTPTGKRGDVWETQVKRP